MIRRETYKELINILDKNQIFVFGSNTEGKHGNGTAKIALKNYGAKYGQGHGLQDNSYGLVTKNLKKGYYDSINNKIYNNIGCRRLEEDDIKININKLYEFANLYSYKEFLIAYTRKGINLNGYSSIEMAKMFNVSENIPNNIIFEEEFYELIRFYKV